MPKSKAPSKTKLHCQHCGKLRQPARFMAIDPEVKDEKGNPTVLPFRIKRFIEVMEKKEMVKMPPFYCGVCSICFQPTYYVGRNRGNSLDVINT